MREEVAVRLLESIAADRLTILVGAGLSAASPSEVPTARDLAQTCAEKHYESTGQDLRTLDAADPLDALASYFHAHGTLESYFIRSLVDWSPFRRYPNLGHMAVADMLCASLVDWVATTNLDDLIEVAAHQLGEADFRASIDVNQANIVRNHRTYLKLHGCCRLDEDRTLWCAAQLGEEPWQNRLDSFRNWLAVHLAERDLVIVGYWTDWDYLIQALLSCLATSPRSVVLVDRADEADLARKAPDLWRWAHADAILFFHEQMSGDTFLDELTTLCGRRFVLQVLAYGGGDAADQEDLDLPELDSNALYNLRRDLTGVSRADAVRVPRPDESFEGVGAFLLKLLTLGGVFDEAEISVAGRRVRVVKGAGRTISSVRAGFGQEITPVGPSADLVVCVGATDDGDVPVDIVRGVVGDSTVVRVSPAGTWVNETMAETILGMVAE